VWTTALKFCLRLVTMKFVDDDDDDGKLQVQLEEAEDRVG